MTQHTRWTRNDILIAFALYCRLAPDQRSQHSPDIINIAAAMGRTSASLSMRLANITSLDPAAQSAGHAGLSHAAAADRTIWDEMQDDWNSFAIESWLAIRPFADATVASSEEQPRPSDLLIGRGRISRGVFRDTIFSAYHERCCITGSSVVSLLRATSIVPLRAGQRNRFSPHNGLLMTALHAAAFQYGLFTIADDHTVVISTHDMVQDDQVYADSISPYQG